MQFASFFYRNFDGDSPTDSLSGHARECSEMQHLFRLALPRKIGTPHHFICIDEYGKGTEDLHASALCCAALELFDQVPSLHECIFQGPYVLAFYRHDSSLKELDLFANSGWFGYGVGRLIQNGIFKVRVL
jgi:hypothetical protein